MALQSLILNIREQYACNEKKHTALLDFLNSQVEYMRNFKYNVDKFAHIIDFAKNLARTIKHVSAVRAHLQSMIKSDEPMLSFF